MEHTTDQKMEQVANQDEAILHQLGYKQVLYRSWGAFTAITITISAMSVLTSISGVHKRRSFALLLAIGLATVVRMTAASSLPLPQESGALVQHLLLLCLSCSFLQHWPELRWPCCLCLGLAWCQLLYVMCGTGDGRALKCLPNFGWHVLL